MITVLDTLGPAIWRASWQAAALAVLDLLMEERGEIPAAPHTEEAETISRG